MTWPLPATRRQFLAASSGGAALALLARAVSAVAPASTPHATECAALVLYRANERHAQQFAGEFALAGYMTRELANDPVRQWRDELGTLVVNDNFLLLGIGNWADFSILRGLAAEHRRFPLLLMQHNKYPQAHAEWADRLARQLLTANCLNNRERLAWCMQNLNTESTINTGQPSLFSWII